MSGDTFWTTLLRCLAAAGDGSGGMCENHAPAGVSVTAGETAAPLGERNLATTLAEAGLSKDGTMVLSVRWGYGGRASSRGLMAQNVCSPFQAPGRRPNASERTGSAE